MTPGKLYKCNLPVAFARKDRPYSLEVGLPKNTMLMVLAVTTLPKNFTSDRIVEVTFLFGKQLIKRRASLINLNQWLKAII